MEKEKLIEELSKLTVLELSELKTALEEKWGVKAAAAVSQVMTAAPVQGGAAADAGESESTDFEITLAEAPADKKIAIIKVVRQVTGLGLKEAKDLVEGAPKVLKDSAPKSEADEIVKQLKESGAKATLRGL